MQIRVAKLNPAGNITLLVSTPVPAEKYSFIANRLLDLKELKAEQVGFLSPTGSGCRLTMMGGEFCGNALRSAGFYTAWKRGVRGKAMIPVTIGWETFSVKVDLEKGEAQTLMPLPEKLTFWNGLEVVVFKGIVHAICPASEPKPGWAKDTAQALAQNFEQKAAGVLFFDPQEKFLRPAVYVRDTDSLIWEGSCASGSSALGAVLAKRFLNGLHFYSIQQPGGVIEVSVEKRDGKLIFLAVGGSVELEGTEFNFNC